MSDKEKGIIGGVIAAALLGFALLSGKAKAAPSLPYCCPYGDELCFATYAELVAHVQSVHPGSRLPLIIEWT